MEEVQDGSSNLALLARIPGVLHSQQLLRLQPLLQVVYQLLTCSSTPFACRATSNRASGASFTECAMQS